jgi:hypothetical protein
MRCALALLLVLTSCSTQEPVTGGIRASFLSPDQQATVNQLLTSRPSWRIATREDHTGPSLAYYLQTDPAFQPYFLEEDFNADGTRDFAIMLRRDSLETDSLFAAYWMSFEDEGYGSPRFLARSEDFDKTAFFWLANRLKIGEPQSDVIHVEFEWNEQVQDLLPVLYDAGE